MLTRLVQVRTITGKVKSIDVSLINDWHLLIITAREIGVSACDNPIKMALLSLENTRVSKG